jgi:hypothetical protein
MKLGEYVQKNINYKMGNMCIFKHFWAHSQNCEKRLLASSYLFVRLSLRLSFAPTGQSFVKFDIVSIFRKFFERIEVS